MKFYPTRFGNTTCFSSNTLSLNLSDANRLPRLSCSSSLFFQRPIYAGVKAPLTPNIMRTRIFLFLSLVVLCGCISETAQASITLNLKDFGAVGDNVADDGPALQQALDALAQAGGGTLFVPKGTYAIVTPVAKDFAGLASSITIVGVESSTVVDITTPGGTELIKGLGLVSEFTPKTGPNQAAIHITGLQTLLFNHLTFLGTAGVPTDAKYSLLLEKIEDANIKHCEFYGLGSWTGAVIMATLSHLKIDQTKFLGCAGSSGTYLPVVQNLRWKGITVTTTAFVDFGLRALYSKTTNGMPISWINIGNAEAVTNDSPRREVVIRNVFLDEGSYMGITSLPYLYSPMTAPIDLVYVTGLRENVSNAAGHGNHFDVLRGLFIEKSKYEWSKNASSAINIRAVGNVILDQVQCLVAANRINATTQTGKLTVVNSIYTYLNSMAQVTRVVTTPTLDEDPVQYVKQQYNLALGHGPDPAGHYYWSDLLLRCEDNQQCVDDTRTALANYLGQLPAPTFAINGRIIGEDGQPTPGVAVKLNGSQAVSTVTDSDGRYHFSGLPTSGNYTIALSKPHYTFNQLSQNFINPGGDQTADFTAILNKYTISGRVRNTVNTTNMAGVTITLSGSQNATTTTDNNGNFSFNLPAFGNYTLTASLKYYSFTLPSLSFNNLVANQTANFGGKIATFTISGDVLKTDGTPLSGVSVTLAGRITTTDALGHYSFSALAAGQNYTLALSKTNYDFTPSGKVINDLSSDQTANFTAALHKYVISGRILNGATGLSGVTVTLSGTQSAVTTTNANGAYSFLASATGNYTVTPTLKNYTFQLPARSFVNLLSNQTADFTAIVPKFTISGRVRNLVNTTNMAGVTITLSGSQTGTTITDANGFYSFQLPALGNYTLTPSLKHYSFTLPSLTFNNLSANQFSYIGGRLNIHKISGTVKNTNGTPLSGVYVRLSGRLAVTDAQGNYSFGNLGAGGNYILTLSKANYTFTPSGQTFNDLGANQTANFTGALIGSQTALSSDADGPYSLTAFVTGDATTAPASTILNWVEVFRGGLARRLDES